MMLSSTEHISIRNLPYFFVELLLMLSNLFGIQSFFRAIIWAHKHVEGSKCKYCNNTGKRRKRLIDHNTSQECQNILNIFEILLIANLPLLNWKLQRKPSHGISLLNRGQYFQNFYCLLECFGSTPVSNKIFLLIFCK